MLAESQECGFPLSTTNCGFSSTILTTLLAKSIAWFQADFVPSVLPMHLMPANHVSKATGKR